MYTYKEAFISHAFTQEEMVLNGATRSHQRFEQCIRLLEAYANPALKALEAKHFFNSEIKNAAANLTREAIQDYKYEVMQRVEDENIRTRILEKLDSIQLIVMFPDDVLNISRISEIYDGLQLDGTESLIKMHAELDMYSQKINREPKSCWLSILSDILGMGQKMYKNDMNIICKGTY